MQTKDFNVSSVWTLMNLLLYCQEYIFPRLAFWCLTLRNRSLVATAIEVIYESEILFENVKIMVINIWLKLLMRNICI